MSINKKGQLIGFDVEPFLTLSDGSKWQLLLYHYVDKGNNLFTNSNATFCNEPGLYSRLRWVDDFIYNNKYEFYVIQDGITHRWTLTSAPTASSITGFTVISGNPVYGLAKGNQSNTYLGYNTWWGACGCWTKYTLSGKTGIPGFGGASVTGMCTQYLALYARIDNIHAFVENGINSANNLYEY